METKAGKEREAISNSILTQYDNDDKNNELIDLYPCNSDQGFLDDEEEYDGFDLHSYECDNGSADIVTVSARHESSSEYCPPSASKGESIIVEISAPIIGGEEAKGQRRITYEGDGTTYSGASCTASSRCRGHFEESFREFPQSDKRDFVLENDPYKPTALHYAKHRNAAKLILETVAPTEAKNFILREDDLGWTVLHLSSYTGRRDVVEYLCTSFPLLVDELVTKKDNHGQTALHVAKDRNVAQIIVEAVAAENQTSFIATADQQGRTALHTTVENKLFDVVEYLCECDMPFSKDLLLKQDFEGKTALHYAEYYEMAEYITECVEDKFEYVNARDHKGYTALMYHTLTFNPEELRLVLEYIEEFSSDDELKCLLEQRSRDGHNIFHLAAMSKDVKKVFPILSDLIDCVDIRNVLLPDNANNTPLDYLVFRCEREIFARVVTSLPFVQRRNVFEHRNIANYDDTSAVSTQLFSEQSKMKLMWQFTSHRIEFKIRAVHRDIFKIVKYGLNEYSLLDSAYVYSWSLFSSSTTQAAAKMLGAACSPLTLTSEKNQNPHSVNEKCTGNGEVNDYKSEKHISTIWLHIDFYEQQNFKSKSEEVQNKLHEMNRQEYHGLPKVIVVRTLDPLTNLIPPGPDYVIINCLYSKIPTASFPATQELNRLPINPLVQHLISDRHVNHIDINSTLCSRYLKGGVSTLNHKRIVGGDYRGKALIICNRTGRADGWEMEFNNAKKLLKDQLGLLVEVRFDQSAAGIVAAISRFSMSEGHGPLVALAIMSHGGDGSISGDNGRERCSVQNVVNSLCVEELKNVSKMVLLSFCRGGISRTNRVIHSWECTRLPKLTGGFPAVDKHPLTESEREAEWRLNPFPYVEVPENCYICYSTLPDSKSERGILFKAFNEYLAGVYKFGSRQHEKCTKSPLDVKCTSSVDQATLENYVPNSCDTANIWCNPADQSARSTGTECQPLQRTESTGTECHSIQNEASIATECHSRQSTSEQSHSLPRIELVNMLTDVAALVREKSRYRQHINHCYKVSIHSRPVFIDILPV